MICHPDKINVLRYAWFLPAVFFWQAAAFGDQLELAREGQAKSDIVVDVKAAEPVGTAVRFLVETIEKTSGARLPVVNSATGHCAHIVINQAQNAALDADGYEIVFPSSDRVLISAQSEKGIVFGIFEFIENYLDVPWLPLNFAFSREKRTFLSVPRKAVRVNHHDLARKMWALPSPSAAQMETACANRIDYLGKGWGLMGFNWEPLSTGTPGKASLNHEIWLQGGKNGPAALGDNVDPADIIQTNTGWVVVSNNLALQLNGTNAYMLIRVDPQSFSRIFSVTYRFKTFSSNGYIIGYNPWFFMRLVLKDSSLRLNAGVNREGCWREVFSKTGVTKGEWYHVGVTYDLNKLRLFINGVEEASQTAPFATGTAKQPDKNSAIFRQLVKATLTPQEWSAVLAGSGFIAFGCTPWKIDESGGFFNGLIYQPRIYQRALSADEMREQYKEGGEICHPPGPMK